jgi:ABC-2 type transport system permease protein
LPSAAVLGLTLLIFVLSVTALGRRFSDDASAAYGSEGRRARTGGRARGRFGASAFGATVTKELRLILRDPGLISQVLLRVLYMIPLIFVVLRTAGEKEQLAVASAAGGLAFMAGQVAGSLSWITVSAEDAPELLAAAPVPMRLIWRAKVAGALLPLAALLAVPLAALAWMRPWAALYAAIGCLGSAVSAAWINVWMQKPGNRREFRRRRDAALAATIAELVVGGLWGAAAGLAVAGMIWALVPLALAILCTLLLRRSEAAVMRRLAEASTA